MCDCYVQKCEMCNREFGIHLADFALDRDEIQVFCKKHIPKDNVAIEEILETGRLWDRLKMGGRVGFRYARLPEGYTFEDFALNTSLQTNMTIIGNPIFEEIPEEARNEPKEVSPRIRPC